MKKVLFIICLLFWGISYVSAAEISENVKLKTCIDGDTAIFLIDDVETKVRFLAINAPEVDGEAYGKEASKVACDLLKNSESILIEYDLNADKDKYDRSLAWVWADDKLLQEELVKNGYAEVAYIYADYKYTNSLCLVQQNAITKKMNIWSNVNKEEDYCARVDTSKIKSNIDYNKIFNKETSEDEIPDDVKDKLNDLQKTADTINKIDQFSNKVTQYLEDDNGGFTNIVLYIVLGIAGIYLLYQTFVTPKK